MPGTDDGSPAAVVRGGETPGPRAPRAEAVPDFAGYAAVRWSRLVCTAYLLTGDHGEAEDLVEATLAKAYLNWTRISRLGEPDAYLHRALVQGHLGRQRRRRVVRLLVPRQAGRAGRDGAAGTGGERAVLMAALARLPVRQRTVVVLRYWADLTEEQIADVLGCTVGTVTGQADRGLRRLRTHPALAGLGDPAAGASAGPGAGTGAAAGASAGLGAGRAGPGASPHTRAAHTTAAPHPGVAPKPGTRPGASADLRAETKAAPKADVRATGPAPSTDARAGAGRVPDTDADAVSAIAGAAEGTAPAAPADTRAGTRNAGREDRR